MKIQTQDISTFLELRVTSNTQHNNYVTVMKSLKNEFHFFTRLTILSPHLEEQCVLNLFISKDLLVMPL